MKIAAIVFSTLLVVFLLSTCYYDSEEYLFPQVNNQCDTTNVTYSLSVQPMLQDYCYGCHSNSNSALGGNIKLEDYADVNIQASNGKLIGAISHSPGFSPMPMGAAKLQDCQIAIVRKWIDSGAPNN